MTESRIPRDLVRAIAIEYIKESKRLGGEIDGLSNALDAQFDELAALVQPAATVHEVTGEQLRDAADAAYVAHVKSPHRWDLIVRAVLDTLQPAAELAGCSPDALPRPITREEMRPGQVVERTTISRYTVQHGERSGDNATLSHPSAQVSDWYLIEDAPDPDAELIEAMAQALYEGGWDDADEAARTHHRHAAERALATVRHHDEARP